MLASIPEIDGGLIALTRFSVSGIVWGAALSVFVTFSGISGGGVIFALAGVLELPVLLCYFWRCSARHQWLIPYPFPRKK